VPSERLEEVCACSGVSVRPSRDSSLVTLREWRRSVNQFPPDCLVEALSQHSSNPSNVDGRDLRPSEREELVDVSDSQFDELLPPEDRQDMKATTV